MVSKSMPNCQEAGHHSAKTKNLSGTNRANNPAETVEDHYRRNLSIPFVDHLINELETRFGSGDQETAVQCLCVL